MLTDKKGIFFSSALFSLILYLHTIVSRLMGVSALKTVLRNIWNSRRNRKKNVEKLNTKIFVNLKKKHFKRFFLYKFYFQLKCQPNVKLHFRKYCKCFELLTKNVMRKLLLFTGFSSISQWVFNIFKNGFQLLYSN